MVISDVIGHCKLTACVCHCIIAVCVWPQVEANLHNNPHTN